ncbi:MULTISPECIES: hypothetical protein [Geobacillus]|jgi:hypothetical protein|uniref:hypothetical protein n=1 Tax=Geobacillus TaxID=129337 RepID=UPI0006E712C5|nr:MULTISPECIES: hypothetical protein [Geobacillus]ARP42235.1 hypothetical protein GTHT12_00675 [Geobacillus thermodenitrificans]KQB93872.1 hypothetical protein GEPA3_1174 [Geobacillus sp. PA-3]MEC5188606.1 hypothetical protein [Geobacillus thermodenitrificans]MED0663636.1 hypothetical protein [Geobacillus thermodenitrificans]NNU86041.1 hypothetical protein [Geobacillus sp. MR]
MGAFWLAISLLLHAFSFLLIILLYMRLSRLGEAEQRAAKRAEELEEAMAAHLVAWKEENERFLGELDALLRTKTTAGAAKQPLASKLAAPAPRSASGGSGSASPTSPTDESGAEEKNGEIAQTGQNDRDVALDYFPDIEAIEDVLDLSPSASAADAARRLHEEGATIEEIAKKLQKGKTEVELLLKFDRKTSE